MFLSLLRVTSVSSLPEAVTVEVASWARSEAEAPLLATVRAPVAWRFVTVFCKLVVSLEKTAVLPEFFIANAVVESVEFWKVVAPPTAMVAWVALLVSKVRELASLVPSTAVAPKVLPPWTKAAPAPVVLQVAS